MSFLLRTLRLQTPTLRQALRPASVPTISQPRRLAHQDYGSGEGDPKGQDPQSQGPNPSENLEHPGPPPPKAAGGSGSGGANGSGQGGESGGKGSPKIHNVNAPTEDQHLSEEAKRHNKEFAGRKVD